MSKATNASSMRTSNRKLILDTIRKSPVSRADIAAVTRLARASVTLIVEELLNEDLVEETSTLRGKVGRSPVLLRIKGSARFIAGVNLKRVGIDVGLVSLDGALLGHTRIPQDGAPVDSILDEIARALRGLIERLHIPPDRMLGVGICAPGPLDFRGGVVLTPPNFDHWHHVPIAQALQVRTGLPAMLENVSNALALEELYFGLGRALTDFIVLQINEGIGSGIITEGKLLRGLCGLGSELGHTSIAFDGPLCACGNRGCLEAFASMPAILRGTPFPDWRAVMDAFGHDPRAQAIVQREADYLAAGIVNAINLFDCARVILRSDIAYKAEPLLTRINALLHERLIMRRLAPARFVLMSDADFSVRTAAIPHINAFFQDAP